MSGSNGESRDFASSFIQFSDEEKSCRGLIEGIGVLFLMDRPFQKRNGLDRMRAPYPITLRCTRARCSIHLHYGPLTGSLFLVVSVRILRALTTFVQELERCCALQSTWTQKTNLPGVVRCVQLTGVALHWGDGGAPGTSPHQRRLPRRAAPTASWTDCAGQSRFPPSQIGAGTRPSRTYVYKLRTLMRRSSATSSAVRYAAVVDSVVRMTQASSTTASATA